MAKITRREVIKTIKPTDNVTKTTVVTNKVTKPKAKPKKIRFEDSLDHISIDKEYKLPLSFVNYHTPYFIKGLEHILSVDPTLYRAIVSQNFERFKNDQEPHNNNDQPVETIKSYWLSLMSSVISQQISGSAAAAIYKRFEDMFTSEPNPQELLTKSVEDLKSIGLSNMKVKYVIDISEKFSDSNCPLSKVEFYQKSSLDEIIDELVKLKGIGEWSAKMFALFTLKEWDVFAETDLGVARGASYYLSKRPELLQQIKQEVMNDDELKLLLKKKGKFEKPNSKRDWIAYHEVYLLSLSKNFQPYRSILTLIFWRLSSTNIEVLDN